MYFIKIILSVQNIYLKSTVVGITKKSDKAACFSTHSIDWKRNVSGYSSTR